MRQRFTPSLKEILAARKQRANEITEMRKTCFNRFAGRPFNGLPTDIILEDLDIHPRASHRPKILLDGHSLLDTKFELQKRKIMRIVISHNKLNDVEMNVDEYGAAQDKFAMQLKSVLDEIQGLCSEQQFQRVLVEVFNYLTETEVIGCGVISEYALARAVWKKLRELSDLDLDILEDVSLAFLMDKRGDGEIDLTLEDILESNRLYGRVVEIIKDLRSPNDEKREYAELFIELLGLNDQDLRIILNP